MIGKRMLSLVYPAIPIQTQQKLSTKQSSEKKPTQNLRTRTDRVAVFALLEDGIRALVPREPSPGAWDCLGVRTGVRRDLRPHSDAQHAARQRHSAANSAGAGGNSVS